MKTHQKAIVRLRPRGEALFVLVAVLAISAVAATSAWAAVTPEFKPVPTKKKFTSSGGKVIFKQGADEQECSANTTAGEVTGARTLGKLVIKLTGCKVDSATKQDCALNSVGAKAGEIVTKSLDGELGTVKTSEAPSGVGLLLKPEESKKWTTLAANECTTETAMDGTVAAEIPVIGKRQTTNKLVIATAAGGQAIRKITLDSGKLEEPELVLWSGTTTLAATSEVAFEEALEVT